MHLKTLSLWDETIHKNSVRFNLCNLAYLVVSILNFFVLVAVILIGAGSIPGTINLGNDFFCSGLCDQVTVLIDFSTSTPNKGKGKSNTERIENCL